VYQEDGAYFSVYLMNTTLASNNNKFYIIQILKSKSANSFLLLTRYGRVGETGVISKDSLPLDKCKALYAKKFREKTGDRKGYTAIAMKTAEEKKQTESQSSQSTTTSS
jgi:predicted DNA-binding WGR domain protein